MKKFVPILLVFSLLVLVAARTVSAQEKFALKQRFPEGKYEMNIGTDMKMNMEIQGKKTPTTQKQNQYWEIVAGATEADGTQKIVMEVKRFAMQQKVAGMDMKYDSDDPKTANSPLKSVGIMVGLKMTVINDKDGKPQSVEGWDEFMEKMIAEGDPGQKMVFESLKDQFKPEMFTKNMTAGQDIMPKDPVAVDDNWKATSSMELPMVGSMEMKTDNTLKSIKTEDGKKIAEIFSKSEVSTAEGKEMEMGPAKMTLNNVDIKTDSTIKMEVETGLIFSNVAEMTMSMEMAVSGGPNAMPAMKMSGTGTTTVTVARKTE